MSIVGEHSADKIMITTSPKLFINYYILFNIWTFFLFEMHVRLLSILLLSQCSGQKQASF